MRRLEEAMKACEQTSGLTIWAHGEMVRDRFIELISNIEHETPLRGDWRLPGWISADLLGDLLPMETLSTYHLWHDCGKPFCLMIDADGRRHFPDHEKVSERVWLEAGGDP